MLKLIEIKKDYILKEQEPVHALKGLSVNFRRNEFVAILGPSGCGKTTLLNIIGGLDRYTSGDLVISGVSTKDFKDRDWDTYRNHSIGFVFQSYNLIGHQNILRNVELALTIGGISRKERKERAIKALEKVGLGGLERKRPNQLSGGQMQRVAIARALVNDPEIILADEPTGALDSETSIQIMDLLKEVASNCLVIMVTHNPELADRYATRIINMKDGELLSDTHPFSSKEEEKEINKLKIEKAKVEETPKKNKRSAMSFFTATGLSFSNLVSKLSRTILIAIAGSIGIVGVSSVLAVSFGVKNYVNDMQDDMLSEYPVTVSEESISLSSLTAGLANWNQKDIPPFEKDHQVGLDSMIQYLMSKYDEFMGSNTTNDISENYIAYIEQLGDDAISALKYNYAIDPTNNIFTDYTRDHTDPNAEKFVTSLNGLTQMYASELKTVSGFSLFSRYISLFTSFMKQLPDNNEFIESQYELIAGSKLPTEKDELVLVVDGDDQTFTDFLYGQMGYYDEKEFYNIAMKALKDSGGDIPEYMKDDQLEYREHFEFDEITSKKYYYYPNIYGEDVQSFEREHVSFKLILNMGEDSTVIPFDCEYDPDTDTLSVNITFSGQGVSFSLVRKGDVVDPDKPYIGNWHPNENLFKAMIDELIEKYPQYSMLKGFGIDYEFLEDSMLLHNGSEEGSQAASLPDSVIQSFVQTQDFEHKTVTVEGYMYDVNPNASYGEMMEMHVVGILKKKSGVNFGSLQSGVYFSKEFTKKYMEDQIKVKIVEAIRQHINDQNKSSDPFKAYVTYRYTSHFDDTKKVKAFGYASSLNTDQASSLSSMINVSMPGMGASVDINKEYVRSLCGYRVVKDESKPVGEQQVFKELPKSISIYPKSFADKYKVTSHLDRWNDDEGIIKVTVGDEVRELSKDMRPEITYNDPVEMIITVIDTMILIITIALISFTSLSLVVSCFMIAVITFISTMERVKEIGVIRSLGGRKKDVSRLFIAECLITGLASGLIGILVTYILQTILNISLLPLGVFGIASLPWYIALAMIGLSILLNVLSGLIPSMRASHQDPVIALRTE